MLLVLVAASVAVGLASRPAQACRGPSTISTRTATATSALTDAGSVAAADTTPPGAIPSAWVEDVVRDGTNDTRGNACAGKTGCINIGTVRVGLTPPMDDLTASAEIGYIVTAVAHDGGRVPTLWDVFPDTADNPPIRLLQDGILAIDFIEPEDDVVSLNFDLLIVPVDAAGNQGTAFRLQVRDSDAGGCQASRVHSATLSPVWLVAAMIVVGMVRRRRQA